MDFSKFTFSKKYIRNEKELELAFDFDLKELTGRNSKTFDDYASLLYFLLNHPEKKIYITLTQTDDFYEDDTKLVINLKPYQEFCKKIGQSGKNRTQAFLAQKVKSYSEDEKRQIIASSTNEDILERVKAFTALEKQDFIGKLANTGIALSTKDFQVDVSRGFSVANVSESEILEIIKNLDPAIRSNVLKSLQELQGENDTLLITDQNKKQIFEQILKQDYSDEFWKLLGNSNPGLADKLAAGQLQIKRKKVIDTLKTRLEGDFPETQGDESWQKWIYDNNWLFGVNYQKPIERQKINITGAMPDYLFPTLDGFADVLEIKLPSFEVIEEDSSHPGSWVWSKHSNYAIGQVVNYLGEIDRLRLEIEAAIERVYKIKFSLIKPRAFILIGKSDTWDQIKKEGLRKLNHSLHGIELLTYLDLVKRGEAFIESSKDEYEN